MKENPHFVEPKTYLVGETKSNWESLDQYLRDTDQEEFATEIAKAQSEGMADGEILCSFFAKACYAALTTKKNENISKVRGIWDNVLGTIRSGHGSVFEHCYLNFMVTGVSRVFTHELVRHRVGTSFSQTSGRYVRGDVLDIVVDPILEPVQDDIEEIREFIQERYKRMVDKMGLNDDGKVPFAEKKKITSALRRIMPNGQANEIAFGVNLRSLRHTITMRTSRHAEWEIRVVFNQIASLVAMKYPGIFADMKREMVDGLWELTFENAI